MKHTENYNLNQWELADRIQMEDFNGDNQKIDAALAGLAATVAKCGNCKITLSSYTGTGTCGISMPNIITFPKKPVFFIIKGNTSFFLGSGTPGIRGTSAATNSSGSLGMQSPELTWTDNIVSFYCSDASHQMNDTSMVYQIISFYTEDAE